MHESHLFVTDVLEETSKRNDVLTPTIRLLRDRTDKTSPTKFLTRSTLLDLQLLTQTTNETWESHLEVDGIVRNMQQRQVHFSIHHDSGANRCVTNKLHLLHDITDIQPYRIQGANSEEGFLTCTKQGILKMLCNDMSTIDVLVYYTPHVEGTIISPSAVCLQDSNPYTIWNKTCDTQTGEGILEFKSRNHHSAYVDIKMTNGLWFSSQAKYIENHIHTSNSPGFIKTMTAEASYELWHQRLAHPGEKIMHNIHNCVDGIPNLSTKRHQFYKCDCCMKAKIQKQPRNVTTSTATKCRGQRFHADFGFVRGPDFHKFDKKRNTFVTSIDKFNSYLLIIDAHTRYTWVFLTSSKDPPLDILTNFLDEHGLQYGERSIRTDQGGELYRSRKVHEVCAKFGYKMQPTGSDNSSQNGIAERPNRTFGNMMRAVLTSAGLGSEFWSFALKYCVYIKNRLPHQYFDYERTPFEAYTGRRPNMSNLRIFGAPVVTKRTGRRSSKLSDHTFSGYFLEFVGTQRNLRYFDPMTKRIKVATHAVFDEGSFTIEKKPPGALALRRAGLSRETLSIENVRTEQQIVVNFKKLSKDAIIPTKGSDGAVGSDLYSAIDTAIPPGTLALISTNLAVKCPLGTYGRIAPRSGMTVKKHLDVLAGVVDNDYRGELRVAVFNFGDTIQKIQKGDRIAQLIFENISYPIFSEKQQLDRTERNKKGFGSTDTTPPNINVIQASVPLYEQNVSKNPNTSNFDQTDTNVISLCNNLTGPTQVHEINIKGSHPSLGLICDDSSRIHQLMLLHCQRGTPAARIKKWRSTLKQAIIHKVNDTVVITKSDLHKAIADLRHAHESKVKITFITKSKVPIHPSTGIPTLYHEQIDNITRILDSIKTSSDIEIPTSSHNTIETLPTEDLSDAVIAKIFQSDDLFCDMTTSHRHSSHSLSTTELNGFTISDMQNPSLAMTNDDIFLYDPNAETAVVRTVNSKQKPRAKKLTRRILKNLPNWKDWKAAEKTQLDLYEKQEMFGKPMPRPKEGNILHLLWAYKIKDDKRLKARCVCNGNVKQKGTVTLDHTFAACLEQPGARIFYGIAAMKGLTIVGADASNAFAEAPAPKAPMFVCIDEAYREWWTDRGGEPIPQGYVLPVRHALQGHPESPRLWSKLIDKIIREKVGLKPTVHEPCLYHGDFNNEKVYLMRQVDDFAVASKNKETSNKVIEAISTHLSVPMHQLGIIDRFNGVDVQQTKDYIKIFNKTYIERILDGYDWSQKEAKAHTHPIPMRDDAPYITRLDTEMGPDISTDPKGYQKVEKENGFKYRKALGELLFCMVTCRPDISFPVIKLAKFANSPSSIHYQAIKNIFRYLRATIDHGLHFWRTETLDVDYLPQIPPPNAFHLQNQILQQQLDQILTFVDADWGQDKNSRKSVTGIAMMFAGCVIYYKTKYQPTVAHSTTEAEFTAACDAAKVTLYVRSILDELGIPQDAATMIYEDNAGALLMGNAGQPTRRTRHMDIKIFSVQEWIEEDLIVLQDIQTSDNISDTFTKQLGRNLFWKHTDTLMGRRYPQYYKGTYTQPNNSLAPKVSTLTGAWGGCCAACTYPSTN